MLSLLEVAMTRLPNQDELWKSFFHVKPLFNGQAVLFGKGRGCQLTWVEAPWCTWRLATLFMVGPCVLDESKIKKAVWEGEETAKAVFTGKSCFGRFKNRKSCFVTFKTNFYVCTFVLPQPQNKEHQPSLFWNRQNVILLGNSC